jgi:hypothetical protein
VILNLVNPRLIFIIKIYHLQLTPKSYEFPIFIKSCLGDNRYLQIDFIFVNYIKSFNKFLKCFQILIQTNDYFFYNYLLALLLFRCQMTRQMLLQNKSLIHLSSVGGKKFLLRHKDEDNTLDNESPTTFETSGQLTHIRWGCLQRHQGFVKMSCVLDVR